MRMVRSIALAVVAGLALVLPAGSATAHVHGITPLLQCSVVPENAGGNQTDTTPASASNGGPIAGLIPATVGQAPLVPGDGGFDAPVGCP